MSGLGSVKSAMEKRAPINNSDVVDLAFSPLVALGRVISNIPPGSEEQGLLAEVELLLNVVTKWGYDYMTEALGVEGQWQEIASNRAGSE